MKSLFRVFLLFLFFMQCLFPIVAEGQISFSDTSRIYTDKGEVASVVYYDKNGTLQFKKIFWQDLPNGTFAFVSKKGFIAVKNGVSLTLDNATPDNITEIGVDEKYNVLTYIWKHGKKEIYTGGLPEGTLETKYEGDNPGVYEWRNGKLIFIRKLSEEDIQAKEKMDKDLEDILKMMNQQVDSIGKQN